MDHLGLVSDCLSVVPEVHGFDFAEAMEVRSAGKQHGYSQKETTLYFEKAKSLSRSCLPRSLSIEQSIPGVLRDLLAILAVV